MDTAHISRTKRVVCLLSVAGMLLTVCAAVYAQQTALHIELILAGYRFDPAELTVEADRPVVLTLSNRDSLTPHNFTLQAAEAGLNIDTDVGAGSSIDVEFTPTAAGTYPFYCNKKLPFMKSHRAHGMQGMLTVTPAAGD